MRARAFKLSVAVLFAVAISIGVSSFRNKAHFWLSEQLFDFSTTRNLRNGGEGPGVGETIELGNLHRANQNRENFKPSQELILLAVVDPNCKACLTAADQLEIVRNGMVKEGVEFAIVSFTFAGNPSEFSVYAERQYEVTDAYLWAWDVQEPSRALAAMVVPSLILVNRNGVVLRTFQGTNANGTIRENMAHQTILEVSQEKTNRTRN